MFDKSGASKSVQFALLEGGLLDGVVTRARFVQQAADLGLPAQEVDEAAGKFLAIAANQNDRRAALRASYDYVVVGSGTSGAVVARGLAEASDAQILLLEAGGQDLNPSILITES